VRAYLVFGSDDGNYWEKLAEVTVSSAQQALNAGREMQAYRHYAATTSRGWMAMTPAIVERDPVVKWEAMNPDQLALEDAAEASRSRVDEAVAAANDTFQKQRDES
jgi:hypothetical protein